MGLDIALMRGGGAKASLDHEVGLGETGLDVAVAVFIAVHDIGRHALGHGLVRAALVEHGRAGFHRLVDVGHVRQHLVVDLDQLQRLTRHLLGNGGNGRDRVAVIERFLARHDVLEDVGDVVGHRLGEVPARHHRLDAFEGLGLRGVDRADARMGVGAAQDLAHQHSGHRHVGAVARPARHLVDAVGAHRAGADDAELAGEGGVLVQGCHDQALLISAAASSTARTILS